MPYWPRLMDRRLAAAYLGTSVRSFTDRVSHKIPSVDPLASRLRWDIRDLDEYVDSMRKREAGEKSFDEKFEEILNG